MNINLSNILQGGKACKNPSISVLKGGIECFIDGKTLVVDDDFIGCIDLLIDCEDCDTCPPQIYTICTCLNSENCECGTCENDICVSYCDQICVDNNTCVECVENSDCKPGLICNGINECGCPDDKPFLVNDTCVECIEDNLNLCLKCENNVYVSTCEDECVYEDISTTNCTAQVGDCVECTNDCPDGKVCVDCECVCPEVFCYQNCQQMDITGDCPVCINGCDPPFECNAIEDGYDCTCSECLNPILEYIDPVTDDFTKIINFTSSEDLNTFTVTEDSCVDSSKVIWEYEASQAQNWIQFGAGSTATLTQNVNSSFKVRASLKYNNGFVATQAIGCYEPQLGIINDPWTTTCTITRPYCSLIYKNNCGVELNNSYATYSEFENIIGDYNQIGKTLETVDLGNGIVAVYVHQYPQLSDPTTISCASMNGVVLPNGSTQADVTDNKVSVISTITICGEEVQITNNERSTCCGNCSYIDTEECTININSYRIGEIDGESVFQYEIVVDDTCTELYDQNVTFSCLLGVPGSTINCDDRMSGGINSPIIDNNKGCRWEWSGVANVISDTSLISFDSGFNQNNVQPYNSSIGVHNSIILSHSGELEVCVYADTCGCNDIDVQCTTTVGACKINTFNLNII